MNIAVLGMGRMGQALAVRLADADHHLTVWNRTPGKAGDALTAGAVEAESISAAMHGADIVITMLATDDAVRAVALADGGVVTALGPDQLYVDASTVSPTLSGDLAQRIGHFVAMPILGAPSAVASGKAGYLAGGAPADLERLAPVLADLTETVHRYPRADLASAAKITSNTLLLTGLVCLAEAFAIGRAGGLDDAQLRGLLGESPMLGPGIKNRFDAVLTGSGDTWWSITLGTKDAQLALDLAASGDEDVPAVATVHARYAQARDSGLADRDVAAVSDLYRR